MRFLIIALLMLLIPCTTKATTEEQTCLALNIYHEANGQSKADMRAVGHTTVNRVKSQKFPRSVCKVVYQKSQFSWTQGKSGSVNSKGLAKASGIAEKILRGEDKDNTNGATYFYNYNQVTPKWSHKMTETLRTDVHSYRKPV